ARHHRKRHWHLFKQTSGALSWDYQPPIHRRPSLSAPVSPSIQTRQWQDLDRAHHVHPFNDPKSLAAKGVRVITRAEGVYVWDSDGNKILDGMAGLWCVNVGYGRREL